MTSLQHYIAELCLYGTSQPDICFHPKFKHKSVATVLRPILIHHSSAAALAHRDFVTSTVLDLLAIPTVF